MDKGYLSEVEELNEQSNSKEAEKDQANPPILAQIEAALKIDTQVTESQKVVKVASENPELSIQIKKGQEKDSINLSKSSLAPESTSLKASETEKTLVNESLQAEKLQPVMDKLEQVSFTNKSEVERSPLTAPIDSSALRSTNVNASNLDKLINQNLQSATQSSLLQQPLNLQEKHASALLGERILMMIGQGKQEVLIRLDPAELGSMHIKLQVQQDQVQLAIQTQVGQSRDIIEQNLPRLREQLAQQGVSLGETSVEQQSQQQNKNNQGRDELQHRSGMLANDSSLQVMDDKSEWIAAKIPLPAQGIDYYA